MKIRGIFSYLIMMVVLASLDGCVSEGYSYAKDPNIVRKWDVIITEVEPREILNTSAVFWIGPFENDEKKGLRITFKEIDDGNKMTIIQPSSRYFKLQAGQRAVYIADKGQVWIQPTDYPLPSEFSATGNGNARSK